MPSKWKFPRYGEAWASCQTCDQDFPSSQVWLNPRWGFQCYLCWDGLLSRDQIMQPIFPGEGTRKTLDPVTDSLLEGAATSVAGLEPTYTYSLRDRITSSAYEVRLVPLFVTAIGRIVYLTTSIPTLTEVIPTADDQVWDGIRINGNWSVYVRSGVLSTELQSGNPGLWIIDGICDFGEIPSNCTINLRDFTTGLVYVVDFDQDPITTTFTEEPSGTVFDGVEVDNGYYAVLNGTLIAYTSPPPGLLYANNCIHVEDGELPIIDHPPTIIDPHFCEADTLVIFDDFNETFCATPNLVIFDNFEAEFCDTPNLLIFDNFD